MIIGILQILAVIFIMTQAGLLLQQYLYKFKVKKSLKLVPSIPGVARRYGLVEVQGPWDMEDRSLVTPKIIRNSPRASLFGVFDGHHGASASQFCADNISKFISHSVSQSKSVIDGLSQAFKKLDAEYCSKEEHISGSTACVVIVDDYDIIVANTGDSRAILVAEPRPNDVCAIALSNDHKPDRIDERDRIAKAGGTVSHWGVWRVEGILAMSRVIGDKSLKKFAIPDPETTIRQIKKGDKYVVVATDGIWDVLRNDEVARICASCSTAEEAALKTMQEVVDRGIVDNSTIIVVDVNS